MHDQAEQLRAMMHRHTRSITVASGKGGVGKSNVTINFALQLRQQGYEVVIFDADIGFSNVDVLLGTRPPFNLSHLINREKTIWEVMHRTPEGLHVITGGSGFNELMYLNNADIEYFVSQVSALNGKMDFILFDAGAGLSKEALKFIAASEETWIVTTPEPTAVTDAYAVIKLVSKTGLDPRLKLIINRAASQAEGIEVAENIQLAARRFLQKDLQYLGAIADDPHVSKAVRQQRPFVLSYPNCKASQDLTACATRYLTELHKRNVNQPSTVKSIFNKMLRWMKMPN